MSDNPISSSASFEVEFNMDEIAETRICAEIRCRRGMTVSIHGDEASQANVDNRFEALGWQGYFCPAHAHLSRT